MERSASPLSSSSSLSDIQRVPPEERETRLVEQAMNQEILVVSSDETLDVALEQLTTHRIRWMPVVEMHESSGQKLVPGRISALDITRAYRETLAKGSRRMRGVVEGTVMLEVLIEPGMPPAGRALREARIPPNCLVVSIRRQNTMLFPRGSTVIEPGDLLTFLVSPDGEERLQAYLAQREERAPAASQSSD